MADDVELLVCVAEAVELPVCDGTVAEAVDEDVEERVAVADIDRDGVTVADGLGPPGPSDPAVHSAGTGHAMGAMIVCPNAFMALVLAAQYVPAGQSSNLFLMTSHILPGILCLHITARTARAVGSVNSSRRRAPSRNSRCGRAVTEVPGSRSKGSVLVVERVLWPTGDPTRVRSVAVAGSYMRRA